MSFLTLDKVSHYYFSQTQFTKALEDISFSIEAGEFISIIGPSGCGKSTILSVIAGIMKQTEGNIYVENKSIHDVDINIGYMLQQDYLFPWKSILDNILIGPKIKDSLSTEMREKASTLLADVKLDGLEQHYPSELSGGMRQRVALIRTLITDPDILLFDEPFSALDYVTKLNLENTVAQIVKSLHKTTILVTHDLGEAISMSDRILLMDTNPGRIANTFTVPTSIRNEKPFYVRRHEDYQPLFDYIWKHLNDEADVERNEV